MQQKKGTKRILVPAVVYLFIVVFSKTRIIATTKKINFSDILYYTNRDQFTKARWTAISSGDCKFIEHHQNSGLVQNKYVVQMVI